MPLTIEAAFDDFLGSLRATRAETTAAKGHRASIEAKLNAEFGATLFRSGSFGNGTNISGYSDVDYFALIPRANLHFDSGYFLGELAEALRDRFPTTPNIRVNGPAVQLPFGLDGAHATEVVPVEMTGWTALGFRQFDMPNGSGGWMFTAPESHNAYVAVADAQLANKAKPLVRFVKAWKYARSVPAKSFYLEIRTAKYAFGETAIVYDIDISRLFDLMLQEQLGQLLDPLFPNDGLYIESANTFLQRVEALDALERAANWARAAVALRQAGNIRAAFDRWQLVFNNSFPAYGP
jgi:hypothetical protein